MDVYRLVPDRLSRQMYELVEGVHVAVYLAEEVRQEYQELGVPPGYAGYVGSRCAPLGRVGAELAVATFYVFAPRLVHACLPSVWEIATPEQLLAARRRGLDQALRRILGDLVDSPEVEQAASLTEQACAALSPAGRVLFAGHATLPEPPEPHLALWQHATLLREHRGDGHVAALLMAGLDPVEALVLHGAVGGPRAFLQQRRGWSSSEWADAHARLEARGLVTADGDATATGHAQRRSVERNTDDSSQQPWQALGPDGCRRLAQLLTPVVEALRAADVEGGVTRRIALPQPQGTG